jgi:hypothetical protein
MRVRRGLCPPLRRHLKRKLPQRFLAKENEDKAKLL